MYWLIYYNIYNTCYINTLNLINMKQNLKKWSLILAVLFMSSCTCDDDMIVNTPLQVQYKTMAHCAGGDAYASLAIFMQQPSATWQIQDYAVTKYTVWYESTTDNSWIKLVIPGAYFTQVHYQGGWDSPDYGPFRSITLKTEQGFLQTWALTSTGYALDPTKVRQVQIEFIFKVHDVWYKTSIDTYPTGYVDTFWV